MAAQVGLKSGEGQRAEVLSKRTLLSPLTDSNGENPMATSPVTQGHLILPPEPGKPRPVVKPRLTPKPFSLERSSTIRPIQAPQLAPKPRPRSSTSPSLMTKLNLPSTPKLEHLSTPKPDPPSAPKPDPPSAPKPDPPSAPKPDPPSAPQLEQVSTPKPDPPSAPKSDPPSTNKPADLSCTPVPKSKPEPVNTTNPEPSSTLKPAHASGTKFDLPSNPKPELPSSTDSYPSLTPKLDPLSSSKPDLSHIPKPGPLDVTMSDPIGQEGNGEGGRGSGPVELEMTTPLPPPTRGTTPRPGSSPPQPAGTLNTGSLGLSRSFRWGRRPLSTELASKFESVAQQTSKADSKGKGPEDGCITTTPETIKASGTPAPASPPLSPMPSPLERGPQKEEEEEEEEEEERNERDRRTGHGSIKKRISLLLDSSLGGGSPGQEAEPHPSVQRVQETDIAVDVKQRIKELMAEKSFSRTPSQRTRFKPRPLSQDLTKWFSVEKLVEPCSPSPGSQEREGTRCRPGVDGEALGEFEDPPFDFCEEREQGVVLLAPPNGVEKGNQGEGLRLLSDAQEAPSNEGRQTCLGPESVEKETCSQPRPWKTPSLKQGGDCGAASSSGLWAEPVFELVPAVGGSVALSECIPPARLENKANTLRRSPRPGADELLPPEERRAQPDLGEGAQTYSELEMEGRREDLLMSQADAEKERRRHIDLDNRRHREAERLKCIELEKEAQKQFERERLKEVDRQKQLELERERLREVERQTQIEVEREVERQKQLELERERLREVERQTQIEVEREVERQKQLELERERLREVERQTQIEIEKERLREMERQTQLELERERLREVERQTQIEIEKEIIREVERQKQLEVERERLREVERQTQIEIEKERLREVERQKELELERERLREVERQTQIEIEKERLREVERQKQLELERERLREVERQKQLELERERLREVERQKQVEVERERLREVERQTQIEIEKEIIREVERQKELEVERERLREVERQTQIEIEKERLREVERQTQLEVERERLREVDIQTQLEVEEKGELKCMEETELESGGQKELKELREGMLAPSWVALTEPAPQYSGREDNVDTEVTYDDFSVKPRKWGLLHRNSSLKEAFRNVQSLPLEDEEEEEKKKERGSRGLGGEGRGQDREHTKEDELESERRMKSKEERRLLEHGKQEEEARANEEVEVEAGSGGVLLRRRERPTAPVPPPKPAGRKPKSPGLTLESLPQSRLQEPAPAGSQWPPDTPPRSPPEQHRAEASGRRRGRSTQAKVLSRRSRSMCQKSSQRECPPEELLRRTRSRSVHRRGGWETEEQIVHSVGRDGAEEGQDTETLVRDRGSRYGTLDRDRGSRYGTLDRGRPPDDSPTPARPGPVPKDSMASQRTTPPATPSGYNTPSTLSPSAFVETEPLVFPEISAPLLDSSAQRSRVQLGKFRQRRAPPSREARRRSALSVQLEGQGLPDEDSRFGDSGSKVDSGDSDTEEQPREAGLSPPSLQPQRVPMFPGMDPSMLKAQLKRRGGEDNRSEQPVPARSPKSPFLPQATRVLPPVGDKENGEEPSPQWLQRLKSKKRLSQHSGDT